jgi:hypothetical protein
MQPCELRKKEKRHLVLLYHSLRFLFDRTQYNSHHIYFGSWCATKSRMFFYMYEERKILFSSRLIFVVITENRF